MIARDPCIGSVFFSLKKLDTNCIGSVVKILIVNQNSFNMYHTQLRWLNHYNTCKDSMLSYLLVWMDKKSMCMQQVSFANRSSCLGPSNIDPIICSKLGCIKITPLRNIKQMLTSSWYYLDSPLQLIFQFVPPKKSHLDTIIFSG